MSETTCRTCRNRIGHYSSIFVCAVHLDYKRLGVPFDCREHQLHVVNPERRSTLINHSEFYRHQSDTGNNPRKETNQCLLPLLQQS